MTETENPTKADSVSSSIMGSRTGESAERTMEREGSGRKYAPIFEQGGTKFIFLYADIAAENEEDAWKTGCGMMLVECILLGCKFTGEVLAWNPADDPKCQQGELGGKRIAVVGGWGEVRRANGGSSATAKLTYSAPSGGAHERKL